ncbi:MAG: hypothetical protein OSB62_07735 [Alphaproteobacteria bacterium]|nr:hypothetical protein [Alphaproteobacteria bacterium]
MEWVAIIISMAAVTISYHAHRISKAKINHELFEKRWEIYTNMGTFCSVVSQEGGLPRISELMPDTEENKRKLRAKKRFFESAEKAFVGVGYHRVRILFGNDIVEYAEELSSAYAWFSSYEPEDEGYAKGRMSHAKKLAEINKNLPEIFKDYLYFGDTNLKSEITFSTLWQTTLHRAKSAYQYCRKRLKKSPEPSEKKE